MYLSEVKLKNFRQFGDPQPEVAIPFTPGVTAIVGENDGGKTAVIDAIRYVLLSRDVDYIRVQQSDFHIRPDGTQAAQITIRCKLVELTDSERGAFVEYLTYGQAGEVTLYITWSAVRLSESTAARRWVDVSVKSGVAGDGPAFEQSARQLLAAAYLRPLRDAEHEMSSGRQSRLSQILQSFPAINAGTTFNPAALPATPEAVGALSLVGLADYLRHLIDEHATVQGAQSTINEEYLSQLSLTGEVLQGQISFADGGTEAARLRNILERLELELLAGPNGTPRGAFGLGSNNLLYMSCELLLLGREPEGFPLLIVEEPEAHLHPQRQLRLMEFLRAATVEQQGRRKVQVIVTTHSPNLSSKIPLPNLVLIHKQRAFALSQGQTALGPADYRFLERFLDVTKANLFFARGVVIAEGDAEAILLPTIASLLGRDLTEHGVSIVNVGGVGLKRFSKILQRASPADSQIQIPVARIADRDVMPDCAPQVLGLVADEADPVWESSRRKWCTKRDFGPDEPTRTVGLQAHDDSLREGDDEYVRTFISEHWTLEYDLSFAGLAREVFIAALLAKNDEAIHVGRKARDEVIAAAEQSYGDLEQQAAGQRDVLCTYIYEEFHSRRASKAVAAQYLAELLQARFGTNTERRGELARVLPPYLLAALAFVTPQAAPAAVP